MKKVILIVGLAVALGVRADLDDAKQNMKDLANSILQLSQNIDSQSIQNPASNYDAISQRFTTLMQVLRGVEFNSASDELQRIIMLTVDALKLSVEKIYQNLE